MAFSRIAFGKFLSEGAGNGIIPGQAHLVAWKKMHMQVLVFTLSGRVGYIQFVAFFLQAPVGLLLPEQVAADQGQVEQDNQRPAQGGWQAEPFLSQSGHALGSR